MEGYFVVFADVAGDVGYVWGHFEALDGADAHAEEGDEWSVAVFLLAFEWDDPVYPEGDSGFFGFCKLDHGCAAFLRCGDDDTVFGDIFDHVEAV